MIRVGLVMGAQRDIFQTRTIYLDSMTHHWHFMQRGLSIEHDDVIVQYMSLHFVAHLEPQIRSPWVISQVHSVSIVHYDILGTRVLVRTTWHKFLHPTNTERLNQSFLNKTYAKIFSTVNGMKRKLFHSCFKIYDLDILIFDTVVFCRYSHRLVRPWGLAFYVFGFLWKGAKPIRGKISQIWSHRFFKKNVYITPLRVVKRHRPNTIQIVWIVK